MCIALLEALSQIDWKQQMEKRFQQALRQHYQKFSAAHGVTPSLPFS